MKPVKLNKDGSPRKIGSGRTLGATSLVSVKMIDLMEKFDPNDVVVVGRVFLQKAGIQPLAKAISEPLTAEQKAGIQIVDVSG